MGTQMMDVFLKNAKENPFGFRVIFRKRRENDKLSKNAESFK